MKREYRIVQMKAERFNIESRRLLFGQWWSRWQTRDWHVSQHSARTTLGDIMKQDQMSHAPKVVYATSGATDTPEVVARGLEGELAGRTAALTVAQTRIVELEAEVKALREILG